jgi:hypothetical protein
MPYTGLTMKALTRARSVINTSIILAVIQRSSSSSPMYYRCCMYDWSYYTFGPCCWDCCYYSWSSVATPPRTRVVLFIFLAERFVIAYHLAVMIRSVRIHWYFLSTWSPYIVIENDRHCTISTWDLVILVIIAGCVVRVA